MNRQDFNYLSSSTHNNNNNNNNNNIQKGSLITRSFPLALLLLLVGGGAIAVLLPVPTVWAQPTFDILRMLVKGLDQLLQALLQTLFQHCQQNMDIIQ
jgi:hypothetical protein